MLPPESEQEALELIENMESYYHEAIIGFEEDDAYYEGLIDDLIEVPEGMDVTIPTTPRAVVDEAVDNAVPREMMFVYPPRALGKNPEEEADLVRQWAKSLWDYWRTSGMDIDPLRDFLKNLFRSGKACFKLTPDYYLWPSMTAEVEEELEEESDEDNDLVMQAVEEIERVRRENVPLVLRSLPPSSFMEDPTVGARKLWFIERYQASLQEVQNTYSLYDDSLLDFQYSAAVPVHEIWTATYVDQHGRLKKGRHFVFINYDMKVNEENSWDSLPYVVKYSGFGREAYDGRPEMKAVGFYTRQNKSMFLAEARRFTHFDSIMSQLAFPVAFIPDRLAIDEIDFSPGSINSVPDDLIEAIQNVWVTPRIPEPAYLNSLNLIGNQIERGTVQRPLRGAGVPGTDSAAQYQLIANQARQRVESGIIAGEQAVSSITSLALMFVDRVFEGRVSIPCAEDPRGSKTLGPKQIRGRYRITCKFKPNEEAEKERKLVLVNDSITKGGLSRYDAYVFAGFENPRELIARADADALMQDPMIRKHLATETLKAWGIDFDAVQVEEQQIEGIKQLMLSEFMNMLQLGTMRDVGDPMSPNGVPQAAPPATPPQGLTLPAGAPAEVAQGGLQQVVSDIGSLEGGIG